ncbi:uncharacterized protein [Chelonus insularis]|uniref:uncharacterized protein n=1 Tax=Chelonus insularis TaxID=460826 RepID=UPI00158B6894|nr:uncharacterized protein LOC118072179 [Chelonus insularis]XP_034947744.1 uncharacterized protein LOC118072179 [Chelonus insularis]
MERMTIFLIVGIIVLNIQVNSVAGEEDKFIIEPYGPEKNYTSVKLANSRDNTQGRTFDCFNFMSSVRINEWNLVERGRKCRGRCVVYRNQTFFHRNESKSAVNVTDYCPGRLRQCKIYKEPEYSQTTIELKRTFSLTPNNEEERYDAWLEYMKSLCATCKCYCDNSYNENKTSSICLDRVSSNTGEGYIISGVRLIVKDKIMKIQYQQAKLSADGFIDQTSGWLENPGCTNVSKMSYGHISLQIDDILLPLKSVVTGLSFAKDANFRRFYLVVYGKDMENITNKSVNSTKYFKPVTQRINLMTSDMELPTTAPIANVTELSEPDKYYVTFQPVVVTNDESEIDEQLMPFLDIRKLSIPDELMKPLNGLGIYWRSFDGYGGYVAFKLIIADSPKNIKQHLRQLQMLGHKPPRSGKTNSPYGYSNFR